MSTVKTTVPRESPDDPQSSRRRGRAGNFEELNAEILGPHHARREQQLLAVARRACDYLGAVAAGQYLGDHDDLFLGRELARVIALYDTDVEG